MDGRLAAAGAAGMETGGGLRKGPFGRELNEDAAHFLDVFVFPDQMLVAQQVVKPSFPASRSASARV